MPELSKKTVKELELICKEKKLTYYSGRKHLTKSEMIEKIVASEEENVKEDNLAKSFSTNDAVEENAKKSNCKEEYIENAAIGTIIAFVDEKGKARSAAIENRSSKKRLLKVVTEFNKEFVVPYEKVLWVRSKNLRWPRGVYDMLKGKCADAEEVR